METNVIWRNARAAVFELDDGGYFTCADTWEIFVNDEPAGTTNTVETYVDGLTPGKRNLIRFVCGERELSVGVTTPAEPFTINVRDCGAKGDAEHDDTTNIQAAIMACPKGGRVLIPAGSYRIKSLFLKSNINIELAEGAVLLARHDRAALAYIPGTVTGDEGAGYAGTDMLPLGRWEGESFSTYCSTFTGLSVHDVCIYGRGAIDGQTDFAEDNWWNQDFKNIFRPEEGREVARPRMIFLSECENVSLAGFTVRNSPAWNIHPILCEHVDALCLSIEGPKNSHNTDGFDPESCGFVRILGCQFSVGDDCIAIKSGKLGIEPELRPATHDMLVSHCYMHDGHGAVVLGSEAAGGIKGPAIGHVSPEAAVGGPIALIEEGDLIQINIPERSLSIVGIAGKEMEPAEVDAVLAKRRAAWKPKANRYTSGTLKFFTEHAVSAIQGGYME